MFLATPAAVPLELVLCASLGIALVAGSAAVVNHLADQHIDARMARTESRPMAMGRITNSQAVIFAGIIGVLGIALLWFLVNPLTAWLNLASWVGYGLIYTLYLKRATSQNIVIEALWRRAAVVRLDRCH